MSGAAIVASNVLCAGGRGTEQVWATIRTGISRIGSSHVMDKHFDAIQMGLVPEDALEPLPPKIEALPLPARARRMLRLAAPTLRAIAPAAGPDPLTLYLGLPELKTEQSPWVASFTRHLAEASGVAIDLNASRLGLVGRAAGLMAIEVALRALEQGTTSTVVVGGIDTFLDLRLIAELDAEGRILGPRVMDGFIPGEGAAFLVLKREEDGGGEAGSSVYVSAAASVLDPGHRYGTEPAKGEGLANAITQMRAKLSGRSAPVTTTFAGFNGENFESKLWGVARLRHTDFFSPSMVMQHPADSIGDTGAASGVIMTAVAAAALAKGHRNGQALVWAASDREQRACALISKSDS